jgi:hypothetical protein
MFWLMRGIQIIEISTLGWLAGCIVQAMWTDLCFLCQLLLSICGLKNLSKNFLQRYVRFKILTSVKTVGFWAVTSRRLVRRYQRSETSYLHLQGRRRRQCVSETVVPSFESGHRHHPHEQFQQQWRVGSGGGKGHFNIMTCRWQTTKTCTLAAVYDNKQSVQCQLRTEKRSSSRVCLRQRKKFDCLWSECLLKCAGSYIQVAVAAHLLVSTLAKTTRSYY